VAANLPFLFVSIKGISSKALQIKCLRHFKNLGLISAHGVFLFFRHETIFFCIFIPDCPRWLFSQTQISNADWSSGMGRLTIAVGYFDVCNTMQGVKEI
jgi:hypothetical protein